MELEGELRMLRPSTMTHKQTLPAGLVEVLKNYTYVGMADPTCVLLQHGTRLYAANVPVLLQDLAYQQASMLGRRDLGLGLLAVLLIMWTRGVPPHVAKSCVPAIATLRAF